MAARWGRLLELARGQDGRATAEAAIEALAAGLDPRMRRGFIVSPLDARAAPKAARWPEGGAAAQPRSLSLLDLASLSDQPEVVGACLAFAPAESWGGLALSAFASLCAARGALGSLERLLDEPGSAGLVVAPGCGAGEPLLAVDFLASAAGMAALARLRDGAGAAFKAWAARRAQTQWQGVLVERAWCAGLSSPMLGPWKRQAERLEGASERWAYALDSARLCASFGKLDSFEREARLATGSMGPWGAYMRGAIMAAGFDGRSVDPKEARELSGIIRGSNWIGVDLGEEAPARLEALAEGRELADGLSDESAGRRRASSMGAARRL